MASRSLGFFISVEMIIPILFITSSLSAQGVGVREGAGQSRAVRMRAFPGVLAHALDWAPPDGRRCAVDTKHQRDLTGEYREQTRFLTCRHGRGFEARLWGGVSLPCASVGRIECVTWRLGFLAGKRGSHED